MKRFIGKARDTMRQYWGRVMRDSEEVNMSRGAHCISKMISWARGDSWRRGREKKK
jgi:hypothetical protein